MLFPHLFSVVSSSFGLTREVAWLLKQPPSDTTDPLGGKAGIGPKDGPNPLVFHWKIHLHTLPCDGEDVLSRLGSHQGAVQEVLGPSVAELPW